MVNVSACVNLPLHHKVQKFSSGTGSLGWSRKKGRKTVVVSEASAITNLWSPYVIGQTIIFSCCFFFFFFFFSSPNLSGLRLDVYHTLAHGVALARIYNAGLKCAARGSLQIQNAKNRHLGTIAQLCRAISSQLRHVSTTEKNLLSTNTSSTCPVLRLGSVTARHLVVGISQTLRR